MATPEQQRRTAEITRVLAANGWGIIAIADDGLAATVTIRKPTAKVLTGSLNENRTALQFLVSQFRWDVSAYSADTLTHNATITTT